MNRAWTRYLPEVLRQWLEGRHNLQKTIGNTGWLLSDRMVRIVLGLTIGAWVARHLGPAQFGELAYVVSFIAFFQVIANLQADGFVVRDIAQERGEITAILGTTVWLRLVFGIAGWLGAVGLMSLLHPGDSRLLQLTLLAGATMVFQAADTVDLWFQSQSQSRRTVIAKFAAYLFSNGLKILLLLFDAPLFAFAAVISLEGAATALGLAVSYRRFPTEQRWKAQLSQAQRLLQLCWPFIASSFMITIFMRIDQIMLKEMLGEHELGIFAAALPISQALSVLPSTVIISLAPLVARKMKEDERLYEDALVAIFRCFALLALLGAALTAAASKWLIGLLYGPQYQFSAVVLGVHVFVNLFIFQGIAQDLWVINKNVRSVLLISTFSAALIGVLSNALLIAEFGVLGAVFSYLLAQCASVVVIPCLLRRDLLHLYKRAFLGLGKAEA